MLTLYFKKGCPYCKKVLENLHGKTAADFQVHYQHNGDNGKRAREIGGKAQFPLLVDAARDVVMYESEDIVRYLNQTYSSSAGGGA